MVAAGITSAVLVALLGIALIFLFRLRRGWNRITLARATTFFAVLTLIGIGIGLVAGGWQSLFGKEVGVTIPVLGAQPRLPDGIVDAITMATIVGGAVDQATLFIEDLTMTTRLLLFANQLTWAVTLGAIAIVALRAAKALREGNIFGFAPRAIMTTAIIVAVGGVAGSMLDDISAWRAGVEALQVTSFGIEGPLAHDFDTYDGDAQLFLSEHGWLTPDGLNITLPFWPLSIGVALALVGTAFRTGQQLQKDVEGLQDDVRGLI